MDTDAGILTCTVSVEKIAPSGVTLNKALLKGANLILGRNEFRDIILKVESGKKALRFKVQETIIHKKFAREGKATIRLPNQNVQLLLSNCPPDKLIIFLKTLTTKLDCLKINGVVSERKKLLSELPRTFHEISPLNIKDLQLVHNTRVKVTEDGTCTGGPTKRKCGVMEGKENIHTTSGIKKARQQQQCSLRSTPSVRRAVPCSLNKEQQRVLQAVVQGKCVFFTGSAGTGKSFLLRRIIGALPPQFTFATASTGVAACHIGGTTLHAFAGMGSGQAGIEQCVQQASRPLVAQQWRKCRHLIVDEISMVDGDFFDKLETVARVLRKDDRPFGGIQLILCGDFLQLPPVTKGNNGKRKFAFQAKTWHSCIEMNLELTDVRRQTDKSFISILQNIRVGRCPHDVMEALTATSRHNIDKEGILATRLCTHKEDVDLINQQQLNKLTGPVKHYDSNDNSDQGLLKVINTMCPVQQRIELKEGAQVMLVKNLDVSSGLVNGARGVVIGFDSDAAAYPKVKFLCGETVTVHPERWSFKVTGGVVLTRRQLPLRLAWAISIHKSQGMSLDSVEISLSRVFESGQAYVALSRARSLQGLRVMDFSSSCVRADPDVLRFYRNMRLANRDLQQTRMSDFYSQ